jgi:hypothetical protein
MANHSEIKVEEGRRSPIFLHSELDDYGLDVYQFRIYCRLARRAGTSGDAYESVQNMSNGCGMCPAKVKAALRYLEDVNLITRISRPGKSSIFRLNDITSWIRPDLAMRRPRSSHIPSTSYDPGHDRTQVMTEPRSSHIPSTSGSQVPGSSHSQVPGSSGSHEVYPSKAIPKGSPPSLSPKGSLLSEREREKNASAFEEGLAHSSGSAYQPEATEQAETPRVNGNIPPPELQINSWIEFRAPGADRAFFDSVLIKVNNFPDKPADSWATAERWIQKQGHLLYSRYIESQRSQPAPQYALTGGAVPVATPMTGVPGAAAYNSQPRAPIAFPYQASDPLDDIRRSREVRSPAAQPVDMGDLIAEIEVQLSQLDMNKQAAVNYMRLHHRWSDTTFSALDEGQLADMRYAMEQALISRSKTNASAAN